MLKKTKKITAVVLLAATSGFLTACDMAYRALDKEGAQEKALVGPVVLFEANPTIEEIQILLSVYGYNPGKIDGTLGPKTRDALGSFQKDAGLKVTNKADEATWNALKYIKDKGLVRGEEVDVVLAQEILKVAGCDPGPADGKIGAKTKKAVKIFQKKHGIFESGKIDYSTLFVMAQYVET